MMVTGMVQIIGELMVYQMVMQINSYQEDYLDMLNRFAILVDDGTTLGIPLGTKLTLGTILGTTDGVKDGTQSLMLKLHLVMWMV